MDGLTMKVEYFHEQLLCMCLCLRFETDFFFSSLVALHRRARFSRGRFVGEGEKKLSKDQK